MTEAVGACFGGSFLSPLRPSDPNAYLLSDGPRKSSTPERPLSSLKAQRLFMKGTLSATRPRSQSLVRPPARVDLTDFDLIKKIGQGGFGEVYLCRKKDSHEVLAMKIMEKSLIWKKNKTQQIKNERDVLARGLTERMVRLEYSFQDRRYLYLAMEYCPGGDLFRLLQSFESLTEDESRLYMAEMVMAVHSLHVLGYIHRDLKPDNFLIDKRGHLKLADFGLTKEGVKYSFADSPVSVEFTREQLAHATKGFSVVGSPDYMAPEVLQRSPGGYGQEVDWWSLGCVFFDTVVGYPPFSAETPMEVFENIANWETLLPDIIEQHLDIFSPELLNLILGLLTSPEKRLGSDIERVFDHAFFNGIQWNALDDTPPLFIPSLTDELDVKYFVDIPPTPSKQELATSDKRFRTNSFQTYYYHQEEAEKRLQELQERSIWKSKLRQTSTMDEAEAEAPSWVTPLKGRFGSVHHDSYSFLRSPPPFATPMKRSPESPEKAIDGFTFERKNSRKMSHSRTASTPRHKIPAMAFSLDQDLCEADEDEDDLESSW